MIVLLAPHLDKPLARVPLLAYQLHLGWTANLVRGALADARATVLARAAAVAHQIDPHHFGAFGILAAWVLGFGAPGLHQHVALADGVLHDGAHGLLARIIGPEHQVGTHGGETERRDGLHERSFVVG